MKIKALASAVALLVLLAMSALAASIPYPTSGAVASTSTITAATSGPVTFYFYGFSASDIDKIKIIDLTTSADSGWFFTNQTTTVGASVQAIWNVDAGDQLEFQLSNVTTGQTFSSIAANSSDGINHFYLTPYTSGGPAGIPAGTFVGAEDLPVGSSDLDYNDYQFVVTNVAASVANAPEPASMALMGAGLLGLGLLRRRSR